MEVFPDLASSLVFKSSLLQSPSPNDSPSFLACALSRKGREQNLSLEDEHGLKALISLGEEKGYLLYDEVKDALSEERLGSEDLDQILLFLGAAGIEVIDSEHRFEGSRQKIDGKGRDEGQPAEWTPERLGKTTDPVRLYLREMATVPLLNQGQEVELAKRIENAQMNVLKAVSRCPLAIAEILDYGKALLAGKTPITKLVNVDKEGRTEENLAARREDVLERIAEIERLETKASTKSQEPATCDLEPATKKGPRLRGPFRNNLSVLRPSTYRPYHHEEQEEDPSYPLGPR